MVDLAMRVAKMVILFYASLVPVLKLALVEHHPVELMEAMYFEPFLNIASRADQYVLPGRKSRKGC